jgi:serine/threonine protein kinase/Tfp pilus assembly protein PilF
VDADLAQDAAAVRAALLERLLADRQSGGARAGTEYRALYAEHRALVDRELAALAGDAVPEPAPRDDLGAVGPYRLLRELGRGGQGIVYLALDVRLGRRVALKVLPALGPNALELARRFQREAAVASRLDHPGICQIHEAGVADGVLFIAMRYVEGETLAARLARARDAHDAQERDGAAPRHELHETLALFEACALALHHAHEAGVVHRDVKPTNVVIDPRGEPVILDFGLAREKDDPALTRTGDFVGTPAYASPERLTGRRADVDRRTDVYSLGVSLYEAVTGLRPFDAPTPEGLFQAILTREPPDPRSLRRGLPFDLKVVLETALAKDAARRYATALDLARELRSVRNGEPIRARSLSVVERLARWARRAPARAALVLVLAVGVPALSALGGHVLATRNELAVGRSVVFQDRIDRAVDRGFATLLSMFADAEGDFREALRLDPANLEATAGLVLCYLRLHQRDGTERIDQALAFLDRQERLIGHDPDLLRVRLLCAEAAGDDEAKDALRREIGEQASALGCILESAHLWDLVLDVPGNRRAAVAMHRLASLACDYSPRPRLYVFVLRGLGASALGDEIEMERVGEAILAHWPGDPDAGLYAAGILPGPHERARRLILEEVLPLQLDRPQAWMLLALRWGSDSDWTRCEEAFERALELGGPNGWILCRLGYLRLSLGRPEEALEDFEEALALPGARPGVRVGRGCARRDLGDLEGAEADYRSAIGDARGYYGGEFQLGRLLARSGRAKEAIPLFRRCLELDDLDSDLWSLLASALAQAGCEAEARATWQEATRRVPSDPELWNRFAWFLVDPHRGPSEWEPEIAVDAVERALALPGGEKPSIMNTYGLALYRRGDDERALQTLRRSAVLQAERGLPPIVENYAYVAAAAARLGRREEALEALCVAREAFAREPDAGSARSALAETEAAVNESQVVAGRSQ